MNGYLIAAIVIAFLIICFFLLKTSLKKQLVADTVPLDETIQEGSAEESQVSDVVEEQIKTAEAAKEEEPETAPEHSEAESGRKNHLYLLWNQEWYLG
jgi:hypothetical protein